MTYNTSTHSYTLADATGSYDWMTEGIDLTDYSDDDMYALIDQNIDNSKEQDVYALDEQVAGMTFPRMGYSTDQVFEDEDAYVAFKKQEIESDYANERDDVFNWLKAQRDQHED